MVEKSEVSSGLEGPPDQSLKNNNHPLQSSVFAQQVEQTTSQIPDFADELNTNEELEERNDNKLEKSNENPLAQSQYYNDNEFLDASGRAKRKNTLKTNAGEDPRSLFGAAKFEHRKFQVRKIV